MHRRLGIPCLGKGEGERGGGGGGGKGYEGLWQSSGKGKNQQAEQYARA